MKLDDNSKEVIITAIITVVTYLLKSFLEKKFSGYPETPKR